MIDQMFINIEDNNTTKIIQEKKLEIKQRGIIHSKVSGRFEVVKELPKNASTFDQIFKYADAYGQLRFAYINNVAQLSPSASKVKKSASAFGGELGLDTADYKGFGFHISTYISQGLHFLNPDKKDLNNDFTNTDYNSFAYIAEANLDYTSKILQAKLGRIKVETPYANSDDIRMSANTFEGAWANINYTSSLTTQVLFLTKWAGYDSQDFTVGASQDTFKDLVSDKSFGMAVASLTYEYSQNSEVSLWYSYIDDMSAITYAEVIGMHLIDGKSFHIDYGVQVSNFSEINGSGVDGNVLGLMSILHYKGMFLGASYNKAWLGEDKYISDGFGGGPYYTSLDEASIALLSEANKGEDIDSFRIGGGYNLKKTGINKLQGYMLELVYGELSSETGTIKEKDLILTYKNAKKWYVEAIYANFDSSYNQNIFDRVTFRANYSF